MIDRETIDWILAAANIVDIVGDYVTLRRKGVLWFVLFGLAKTTQYIGLAIIGVEGWRRLKVKFVKDKDIKK